MLGTCLENVRTQVPLVHNITNYVTVNDVATYCLPVAEARSWQMRQRKWKISPASAAA